MGMFSSLVGGGGSAKRAAAVVAQGQQAAGQLVADQYKAAQSNYQPYMNAGVSAMGNYQNLAAGLPDQFNPILGQMGTTVSSMQPIVDKLTSNNLNDYQKSPGYDFRMQQGQKALENSAAARGTLFSGATGKALTEYGQNFGSNEYQNYLANLQGQLGAVNTQLGAQGNYLGSTMNAANAEMNPYGTLMNQGANMTQNLGQLGANSAAQQGQYITGAADATAQGMVAKNNQLQQAGQQWIQLGAMAAGGALGGAAGMAMGGQLGGALTGQPQQTAQTQQPYQGAGYQPYQQNTQSQAMQYQPPPMQAYNAPTAQYGGANMYNPTQNMGQSMGIGGGF